MVHNVVKITFTTFHWHKGSIAMLPDPSSLLQKGWYPRLEIMFVCVCMRLYEREVTGSHSTRAKRFLSRHPWTWDITTDSPLTRLAMAPAVTKVSASKGWRGRIRLKCTLASWWMQRSPRSGINVVQKCFSEGGDSILSFFPWEPLRARLQDYY